MGITAQEAKALAKDIDDIAADLAAHVIGRDPVASSMALLKLAAEVIYHEDGDQEELLMTARVAWETVQSAHEGGKRCAHH